MMIIMKNTKIEPWEREVRRAEGLQNKPRRRTCHTYFNGKQNPRNIEVFVKFYHCRAMHCNTEPNEIRTEQSEYISNTCKKGKN